MANMNEAKIIQKLHAHSKLMSESGKIVKENDGGKYVYYCPDCGYEFKTDTELDDSMTCKCPECGSTITKECTKKVKESVDPKNPAGTDDEPDLYIMDQMYQCPECGDYFSAPMKFTGECSCPDCGATITPTYIGEVDEVTESTDESDDSLNELQIKVTGGKVVKFAKAAKKGYKRIGGKLVKMTSKEKAARKKAGKSLARKGLGNKGAAKMKRKKSMKKRSSMNSSMNVDEGILMNMLNSVIGDVMEHYKDTYYGFKVTDIKEAVFDSSANTLTLESVVTYEDNDTSDAKFVIEGFGTDELSVKETEGILSLEGLSINAKGSINESCIDLTEMGYKLTIGDDTFEESFEVE